MGKTEQDVLATVEKEYIYGDKGEAPVRDAGMNGSVSKPSSTANASNENTSAASKPATTASGKRADYYKGVKDAAPATQVETVKGLFFTVQVGVYSKPVPATNLKNISPLNSELTQNEKIRYTSGIYNNLEDAVEQRNAAKQLGIVDAFITAYFNGNRITLSEADRLLKENGPAILVK
jgi:cell division protein FtsN